MDEEDGSDLWKLEFTKPINSSMAITADNIGYVGCEDGNIYGIDLDEGRVLWSYSTSGGIHSSPAIANGYLIFGSKDGNLYALKEEGSQ
jgi:outer membrane protein assembly factor BamB